MIDVAGPSTSIPGLDVRPHLARPRSKSARCRKRSTPTSSASISPEAIASDRGQPGLDRHPGGAHQRRARRGGRFRSAALMPGRASLIQLDGWTNEEHGHSPPMPARSIAWPAAARSATGSDSAAARRRATARRCGRPGRTSARAHRRRPSHAARGLARTPVHDRPRCGSRRYPPRGAGSRPCVANVPVFVLAQSASSRSSRPCSGASAEEASRSSIVGGREARDPAAALLKQPRRARGHRRGAPDAATRRRCVRRGVHAAARPGTAAGVRFCIATGDDFSQRSQSALPRRDRRWRSAWPEDTRAGSHHSRRMPAEILGVGRPHRHRWSKGQRCDADRDRRQTRSN